ncbi:hypothetical protein MHYP_G00104390 [Metynnis hypsauchen]
MASCLKSDLSCMVCSKLYRKPQLLSCGHSFCRCCLENLWTTNSTYVCSVCQQSTGQKPVANLALRNACESYLREKEEENEGEVRCFLHGEKMSFFCEKDEKVICSQCKMHSHGPHRVQPLAQAVQQRKRQVKAALRPAEKALESLRHGTTAHAKINGFSQQTEKLIRKNFEKLHQFLKEEEEERIAALKKEEEKIREIVEEKVEQQILSLSDRVRDVEDKLKDDDVTFLQNFHSILQRAQCTVPELDSGAPIDVAKHLGNLRYRVWEKMKDICPYYPVVLDPNTVPADFSISGDLTCVEESTSNVPHHSNRVVLGSEGYIGGFHCWDVEVGDSQNWTIGVCEDTAARRPIKRLTPGNRFWGLSCEEGVYKVLGSPSNLWLDKMPRTVRVKLVDCFLWRTLSFFNSSDGSKIGGFRFEVPAGLKLFPFLIPGKHPSVLRIQQEHKEKRTGRPRAETKEKCTVSGQKIFIVISRPDNDADVKSN